MTAIRVAVQSTFADADDRIPGLLDYSQRVREEAGCIQAEDFRSSEFPNNVMHLQLWEDSASFDAFWKKQGDRGILNDARTWQTPHHYGLPGAPRRHGQTGIEFYRHEYFGRAENVWVLADEKERSQSIRFPAWSLVRILIQGTVPPDWDASTQLDNAQETRLEPGCIQFENYRGIEFPENTCLIELWSSPEIYDIHWLNRLVQQEARAGGPAGQRPQADRRYSRPGAEWYAHSYFTLVDGVWQPEETDRRMVTVRW